MTKLFSTNNILMIAFFGIIALIGYSFLKDKKENNTTTAVTESKSYITESQFIKLQNSFAFLEADVKTLQQENQELRELIAGINMPESIEPKRVVINRKANLNPVYKKINRIELSLRELTRDQRNIQRAVYSNRRRVSRFADMFKIVDKAPSHYRQYSIWLPPEYRSGK